MVVTEDEVENFESFRDCLSSTVLQKLAPVGGKARKRVKGRKNEIKPVARVDPEPEKADTTALNDFIEYLAEEMFLSLPAPLRKISYAALQDDEELRAMYEIPLDGGVVEGLTGAMPPGISDSLCAYGLMDERSDMERFLEAPVSAYISAATAPTSEYTPTVTASRPKGCEICFREQLPLTYHHLIPREVHAKVVKRGWHREWELNKVAWLCRACHSYVHKIASNEQLARELYSVDLLLEREDVQKWASWVSKIRWKAR